MNSLLKRFDEPHKKIHGVGVQVQELVAGGEHEQATRLIESTRQNVLSTMFSVRRTCRQPRSEISVFPGFFKRGLDCRERQQQR